MDKILSEKGSKKKGGDQKEAVARAEGIRELRIQMQDIPKLETELNTQVFKPGSGELVGLSSQVAAKRLEDNGPNALEEKEGEPWYCVFIGEMTGFFSLLLWFGSFLCFIGYAIQKDKSDKSNLYLGIVLAVVTFVTGCFSYFQTSKSAALMAQFKNFIPPVASVQRDGKKSQVNAADLVVGDVVFVNNGDNIPADLILFKTNEMKVNNASLTGESEDLLRLPESKNINIFESGNVAFFGTSCTNGNGVGICF